MKGLIHSFSLSFSSKIFFIIRVFKLYLHILCCGVSFLLLFHLYQILSPKKATECVVTMILVIFVICVPNLSVSRLVVLFFVYETKSVLGPSIIWRLITFFYNELHYELFFIVNIFENLLVKVLSIYQIIRLTRSFSL